MKSEGSPAEFVDTKMGGQPQTEAVRLLLQLHVNVQDIADLDPLGSHLDSLQTAELTTLLDDLGLVVEESDLVSMNIGDLDGVLRTVTRRSRPSRDGGELSLAPPRSGRRIKLVAPSQELMSFFYAVATDETIGFRWRFRGSVPSPEAFQSTFWQGTLVQFAVLMTETDDPIGHVVCYGHEPNHQFAYVGMVFVPPVHGTGLPMEAAGYFLNYLFSTWNLRKLYFELPEFNYDQFRSGVGRYFHEEGRLRKHEFYAGRYWDKIYLAAYRDDIEPVLRGQVELASSLEA